MRTELLVIFKKLLFLGSQSTCTFGPLKVTSASVNASHYWTHFAYEEYSSNFFATVQLECPPDHVIDIGANHGFISCVMAHNFRNARFICVEPNPQLQKYLNINIEQNGFSGRTRIIQALVGDKSDVGVDFSINKATHVDSRVNGFGKGWKRIKSKMVCLDDLTSEITDDERVFIKSDTQGFEQQVFEGGKKFLSTHRNWLAKVEFAPAYLKSQGTDAIEFLRFLVNRYAVTEFETFTRMQDGTIEKRFSRQLTEADIVEFSTCVEALHRGNNGWVDLLVRPK